MDSKLVYETFDAIVAQDARLAVFQNTGQSLCQCPAFVCGCASLRNDHDDHTTPCPTHQPPMANDQPPTDHPWLAHHDHDQPTISGLERASPLAKDIEWLAATYQDVAVPEVGPYGKAYSAFIKVSERGNRGRTDT